MGCEFFGYGGLIGNPVGGRFAKPPFGVEKWHPAVAVNFSKTPKDDGGSTVVIDFDSYPKRASYADFSLSNIRLNGNTDGNLNVVIEDGAGTTVNEFTVEYFSSGYALTGLKLVKINCISSVEASVEAGLLTVGAGSAIGDGALEAPVDDPNYAGAFDVEFFFMGFDMSDGAVGLRGGVLIEGTETHDNLIGFDIDALSGLAFNDTLIGYGGIDILQAGDGDDTLDGGTGADWMSGGKGNDLYLVRAGDGDLNPSGSASDQIVEYEGEGNADKVKFLDVTAAEIEIIGDASSTYFITKNAAGERTYTGVWENDTGFDDDTGEFIGSRLFDFVESFEFSDGTIWDKTTGLMQVGTENGDVQYATRVGDYLGGRGGADRLYGGNGDDTLEGGTGADAMSGGKGNDLYLIKGGDGARRIERENINETVADGGADILRFTDVASNELRLVGGGSDLLDFITRADGLKANSHTGVYVSDGFSPNSGKYLGHNLFERIEQIEFSDGVIWDASTGATMTGTKGFDQLYASKSGDLMIGRAGADNIFGGSGDDVGIGGAGKDNLYGNDGDDTLSGNAGADEMLGGKGNDLLKGGGGSDVELRGNAGDDIIFGGKGNDSIFGDSGDDTIVGGRGKDWLKGGSGADVFVFENAKDSKPGQKADTITDFKAKDGDQISLAFLDGEELIFLGAKAFSGRAGEVRAVQKFGTQTNLLVDVDGDRTADFRVILNGIRPFGEDDLLV